MKNYLAEIKKTEGGRDQFIFSGQLTIEHAGEIKSGLMQLMSAFSTSLEIIVEDVIDIDLSFIQLLQSFVKLLKKENIDFTVNWRIDEEHMKLLTGAGFSKWL